MNTYYLYINMDDLNRFLVENLIFPHNEEYWGRRTLSLIYDNVLMLSKKKYNKEIIANYCNDGYTSAVVLELDLKLDKANIVYRDDDLLLINNIISFGNVKKIYNVFEEMPGFIFNDIYLFDSLVEEVFFDCGEDIIDIQEIGDKVCFDNVKDLQSIVKYWSKSKVFIAQDLGHF